MSRLETPFRYDHVGSFLRPEKLKEARRKFDDGDIGYEELKKVEDEAITELVGKLKEIGYHVITDGEFRRATWHLDFMWGFDGVGHVETKTGLPFHGEAAMIDDTFLVGKVKVSKEHPFVEHFRFVSSLRTKKQLQNRQFLHRHSSLHSLQCLSTELRQKSIIHLTMNLQMIL